jgi:hypothetical protein
MSRVPNFADLPLSDVSSRSDASLDRNAWRQRAAAVHGESAPQLGPFLRGPYPRCTRCGRGPSASTPASRPLKNPTPSTGATSPPARRACRSPSTSRPTAATTATIRACRRRRHGGRGHRFDLRHAHAVRRHPARQDERVDDHERRGAAVMALYIVAAEEQGVSPEKLAGHHPERHPQGVHGPQHLHLPAAAEMRIISDIFAYTSQNMPKFNSHLDLRLSHAGSRRDGRPGAGLHAGRRARVCPHRRGAGLTSMRLPRAVVLLGDRHELLHGSRQDARRAHAVGQAHQGLRPEEPQDRCAAHALARRPAGR